MPRILVVDDALFMRTAIRNMLESWGLEVVGEAANGREAIKMYESLKPDLVTMDLTMPVMTGIEALKVIMEEDPKAKVIMITALGQQRFIKEAVEIGAKDFITKPFQPDKLKEIVMTVLSLDS